MNNDFGALKSAMHESKATPNKGCDVSHVDVLTCCSWAALNFKLNFKL